MQQNHNNLDRKTAGVPSHFATEPGKPLCYRRYIMLHQAIQVGSLLLKNRLVMPPMATELSAGGAVTDSLIRFYDERSKGGYLGLIIQEHSYVSPEGQASPGQVSVADDSCIESLRRVTDAIHANGVPVIAQISHAGSAACVSQSGLEAISASAVPTPRRTSPDMVPLIPREMTLADIDRVTACFANAAERAKKAGYDGVEIHCAHGYLLNQFYSPLSNLRADAYTAANLEGRTRFPVQVIRAVRERCGEDFLISLRLGASDYREGGAELSEVPEAARIFAEAGIDMLSITGGMCGFNLPGHREQGWFAELSEAAKSAIDIPVLLTGGITEKAAAEELLERGAADLIGVGRAFLRDSALPEKWMK